MLHLTLSVSAYLNLKIAISLPEHFAYYNSSHPITINLLSLNHLIRYSKLTSTTKRERYMPTHFIRSSIQWDSVGNAGKSTYIYLRRCSIS